MGFYSTHVWDSGAICTVELVAPNQVNIRVQNEMEVMLCDFIMGRYEAMCLLSSIATVLTKQVNKNER